MIQRYAWTPDCLAPRSTGDCVLYADHRAAVRELVEALGYALTHIPTAYDHEREQVRAAIAKYQEEKE